MFALHLQLELLTYFGRVNKYLLHIVSKGRARLIVGTLSFIILCLSALQIPVKQKVGTFQWEIILYLNKYVFI